MCWMMQIWLTCWTADLSNVFVGSVNARQCSGTAPLRATLRGIGRACRSSRLGKRPSADWVHRSGAEIAGDESSETGGVDADSCYCQKQNSGLANHDD